MVAKKKSVTKRAVASVKNTETVKSIIEYKKGRDHRETWSIELKNKDVVKIIPDCGEEEEMHRVLWIALKAAIDKAFGIK